MKKPLRLVLSLSLFSSLAFGDPLESSARTLQLEALKARIESLSGHPYQADQKLQELYESLPREEQIALLKNFQQETQKYLSEIKRIEADAAQAGHPLEQVPLPPFMVGAGALLYSVTVRPKSKASLLIGAAALLLTVGMTAKNEHENRFLTIDIEKLPELRKNMERTLRATATLLEIYENESKLSEMGL